MSKPIPANAITEASNVAPAPNLPAIADNTDAVTSAAKRPSPADLEKVAWMPPQELKELFKVLFGHQVPKHARRDFILGNVLYQLQVEEFGGLSARTKKQIEQLIERFEKNPEYRPPSALPEFKPGTKLLREFRGKTHEVIVAHDGFIYKGLPYPSLTRITREITGVSWNGRAFFGVSHGR